MRVKGLLNITEANKPVADNLEYIIKEKRMKQCTVAECAGFSKQQFNDMLNGRKIIKPCDVLAITNALGIDANILFRMRGGD